MIDVKRLEQSVNNQKIDIDRSKLARNVQSDITTRNRSEIGKLLFLADQNQGRREELARIFQMRRTADSRAGESASYGTDQIQYVLQLMLILTVAETRTQVVYSQDFSERCDRICAAHGLQDDQYWREEATPDEWRELVAEFEQRSIQILVETLREYNLDDIAELVQQNGTQELLDIIKSVEGQFLSILKDPSFRIRKMSMMRDGSIPETLQMKK